MINVNTAINKIAKQIAIKSTVSMSLSVTSVIFYFLIWACPVEAGTGCRCNLSLHFVRKRIFACIPHANFPQNRNECPDF